MFDPSPRRLQPPKRVRNRAGDRLDSRLVPGELPTQTEKRVSAEAAAELVEDGTKVGLGTGSTVAFLLPALAARKLSIHCVATSPATEQHAAELGIEVGPFDDVPTKDVVIKSIRKAE